MKTKAQVPEDIEKIDYDSDTFIVNGDAVLLNALVVLDFHVLQQLLEKSVLLGIHVVIRRHGQQLFLCH